MGNRFSREADEPFIKRVFNCFKSSTADVVEIHSRKPGVMSREAVRWFMDRDQKTFNQSVSFVPRVIRRGLNTRTVMDSTESIVAYRGQGAVVFCDASGFTKLTESFAQRANGAELLSSVMNQFFTPLIDIIEAYRGDIIKFSGDALTILFSTDADEPRIEGGKECGSEWSKCSGHSALELAVLRASACCIEIHKKLDNFDTGYDEKKLSFHIGVGCGHCVVLHLGGTAPPEDPKTRRFEYVLAGEAIEQIAHACKYAEVYETVLSPEAWDLVKDTVLEGDPIPSDPSYKKLLGFQTSKHTYATIRAAAESSDSRAFENLQLDQLSLTRRYIPSAVFQQMANGTLEYVNEIRNVTVFFICVPSLDVSSPEGTVMAQDLMSSVQQACFQQEGQVNKFLVDDKGLLFLCVFGTPPLVHTDDPLRAINACFSIIHSLKRLNLAGNFGLSSGRVFCGMVGSSARQEYTTLGDSVNLAARLMQLGNPNVVIVDEASYEQTKNDLDFEILAPVALKGKQNSVKIFKPQPKQLTGTMLGEEARVDSPTRRGTRVTDAIEAVATTKDPLIDCMQWRELELVKKIITDSQIVSLGGTLVLGGASGLGKDQLCQYVITAARTWNRNSVAVYATDRGLPKDRARPIVELIETCLSLAVACGMVSDPRASKLELLANLIDEPLTDIAAGATVNEGMIEMPLLSGYTAGTTSDAVPNQKSNMAQARTRRLSRFLSIKEDDSHNLSAREMDVPFEHTFIGYCEKLLLEILEKRPVVLVMRISRGTSLFNIVNNPTFWKLAARMSALAKNRQTPNPLSVLVLCRSGESAVAENLPQEVNRVELQPVTRICLEEYLGKILREEESVPGTLIDFVEELTQGNPLYVLETLEQLVSRKYVSRSSQGLITVNVPDLRLSVNVAEWNHTAMVGKVICQLEALAPQEAAIVKMASVFEGPFSVLDLAASLKSPYLQAQRFDNYRMYRTCVRLVKMGILSEISQYLSSESNIVPVNDMSRFPKETDEKFKASVENIPMFSLDNLLIRKVAYGMVLHQQALKIKRQALMHRVITRDVPGRLKEQHERTDKLQTPYYNLVKL
jgi:class 3 adenylate cyclase